MPTDLKQRIEEIRERAAAKYENVSLPEPFEFCPGCGCASFGAARRDVDTLIAAVGRQDAEIEELKSVIVAVAASVTLEQAREALQRVRVGPAR